MEYVRPDPDELLKQVQKEERERSQGKLNRSRGYSAGVGKTYSMLEDAHNRLKQGTDVVIACVESHGRKETERLLVGLESVPQKMVAYRGMALQEVDLDAVLARSPSWSWSMSLPIPTHLPRLLFGTKRYQGRARAACRGH